MNEIRISAVGTFPQAPMFRWLEAHFPVHVLPEEECLKADFLFCDTFRYTWEKFDGVRIMITGENHPHDLNFFDYCLSHYTEESDRCHYLPYGLYTCLFDEERRRALTTPRVPLTASELHEQNRGFCAFVSYNAAAKKRVHFVRSLMKQHHVSCGGPLFNNVGGAVYDKVGFLSKHLFSIAYENESAPGYVTEKIVDAFVARSIPIYWGNPQVAQIFNPKAFVNAHDFRNEEELIAYLTELSKDEERLAAMLNEPPLLSPTQLDEAEEALRAFCKRIFERGPGAVQRTRWQKTKARLSHLYGHGFFRTWRRVTRTIRGKKSRN